MSGIGEMQPYYRALEIQRVRPEDVAKQDAQIKEAKSAEKEIPNYSKETSLQIEDTRKTTTDLENVSLTFHKEDSFDYIGSESGLADLDMQKAISDMQKDKIFMEYQYFVGSAQNLLNESQDGTVLQKIMKAD